MIEKLKKLIDESETIIIGAGAGLSAAAGFEYGGDFFKEHFPEMYKLGYKEMYSAGFHHFDSSEEKWAYWAKQIFYNRYQGVKELYKDLFEVVKDKNYFVITTNVDHQFQLAGFDKNKKILFLEFGVGWNTPAIIKYPFIKMTRQFNNAYYVCINKRDNYVPDEIKSKSLIVNEDINKVIQSIRK